MGKETVRYPDALVARVEEFVADAEAFESKSEFHRFASEFLLTCLEPDHDPSVLGYEAIRADLETASGVSLDPEEVTTGDGDTPFLQAYLTVRRYLLHGERERARTYVTETYDIADREALLLDEFIGRFRAGRDRTGTRPAGGQSQGQSQTAGPAPAPSAVDRDRERTHDRPARADGSSDPTDPPRDERPDEHDADGETTPGETERSPETTY